MKRQRSGSVQFDGSPRTGAGPTRIRCTGTARSPSLRISRLWPCGRSISPAGPRHRAGPPRRTGPAAPSRPPVPHRRSSCSQRAGASREARHHASVGLARSQATHDAALARSVRTIRPGRSMAASCGTGGTPAHSRGPASTWSTQHQAQRYHVNERSRVVPLMQLADDQSDRLRRSTRHTGRQPPSSSRVPLRGPGMTERQNQSSRSGKIL